ncbi:GMC oxidoreductase [Rickenella mellea]|uniref:GMC oxidoreductase n=1 Tax=Rickenella mellea TaxID=50990 RepID=A0A4Y7QGX3_9AGAM|nr:GMC oxidoreductase [Rickenella mellea]
MADKHPTLQLIATSASVIGGVLALASLAATQIERSKKNKPGLVKCTSKEVGSEVWSGDVTPEYDVVVVGGGTAGCALASRLSEDPNIRVLLLEAGGSGKILPFSLIPGGYSKLFKTEHEFALRTVEQQDGRDRFWPRAKMLGGCSAINAMMFHQGAPTDYDEWAQSGEEGAEQWAFKNFQKYFLKFEKFNPHASSPDVDASLRGASGPIDIGFFGNFSQVAQTFVKTCVNLGIPKTNDFNTAAGTLGVSRVLTYINDKGQRVSTEAAYLTPAVLSRPNLKVATHAHVTKMLVEDVLDGDKKVKRAVGVEFCEKKGGVRYRVKARREVVLSAGAVHTPHILLLSGIGPAAHLAAHNIPLTHDLPGVGQHLMDHAVVNVIYQVQPGLSLNWLRSLSFVDKMRQIAALLQWKTSGTGPLTSNIAEAAAFVKTTDPHLFPKSEFPTDVKDHSSGADAPDLEFYASPFSWKQHGEVDHPSDESICLGAVLLRPESTGSITLKSADPFDPPIIDPNYLSTQNDIAVLARGLRILLRIGHADPFSTLLDPPSSRSPDIDNTLSPSSSDSQLESLIRSRVETLYHPTSSARMAPLKDGGVVDAYLRVHGVQGLRVADASVFPTIVAGHTAAPSIAVGEKAADIIKESI